MHMVAVIGSHQCESHTEAEEVGKLLAWHQFVVLTGGRGGVVVVVATPKQAVHEVLRHFRKG